MQGHFFDGSPMPSVPSPVTIECAGGLYSTANDMAKWMAWHLDRDDAADADWRAIEPRRLALARRPRAGRRHGRRRRRWAPWGSAG